MSSTRRASELLHREQNTRRDAVAVGALQMIVVRDLRRIHAGTDRYLIQSVNGDFQIPGRRADRRLAVGRQWLIYPRCLRVPPGP